MTYRARTFLVPLALLMTTVLGVASVAGQETTPQTPTIVTVGEANIRRAPDQAFLAFAVETRAKLPRDAQRLNATAMTSVDRKLADLGIAKDAIRTTGFSIEQEYDYANGRRTPREFVARNGIEVRLDATERAGEVLDAVVQAGATSVSGVRFDLKDRVAVERDALRHAVEDARARADALAAGAGRTVDRVLKIDDTRSPRVMPPQPMMAMRTAVADGAQTPIEPGMIEIHAQVTLTVSIK
jgi:uncharacterized protein YggE